MIAEPLNDRTLKAHLDHVKAESKRRSEAAIMSLSLKVANLTKAKLTMRTHRQDEPTNASPGGPPALVSGQLRRAVGTEKQSGRHVLVRVGVRDSSRSAYRASKHPRKTLALGPGGSKTSDNGTVGKALEHGLRGGRSYPFLKPAFKEGTSGFEGLFKYEFSKGDWH
jgi:hypothetical protein